MLIKNKSDQGEGKSLQPADLICYEHDGLPVLGIVQDFRKGKFVVLDMRGRELELSADRLHRVPLKERVPLETKQAKTDWLLSLDQAAKNASGQINLAELWNLVGEASEELDNSRLCGLLFKDDNTANHLAVRYALLHDKVYFKRRQDFFSPRSDTQVEQLRKAEEARQRKTSSFQALIDCFKARLQGKSCALPEGSEEIVCLLEDIAADASHLDNSRKREGKELLLKISEQLALELSGNIPEKAFALLTKVGHFGPITNLSLIRFRIPRRFSDAALSEADALDPSAFSAVTVWGAKIERQDLRDLEVVAIDDESTKDMDDALSLEESSSGYRLGIHISDVASAIDPNSTIEREARRRATSVYCPEVTVNMLPEALSEDKLSLLPDRERLCLSVICNLDRSFALQNYQIVHSTIVVKKRYVYGSADAALEQQTDRVLQKYYEIACHFEAERFKQGGFRVNKGDVAVKVQPNGDFSVSELDESTPARALVGEMMVLANSIFSNFAVQNKVPLIFRGQDQPELDLDRAPADIPPGPAEDYFKRSQLKKSFISTKAVSHATLGLKAYAQVTSPIRRYLDLCNQRQISEFILNGKPFYSASELSDLAQEVESSLRTALTLTRETKRFWLLKQIERLMQRKVQLSGTVIRVDQPSPQVEISDIYMNALIKGTRKFNLGEKIQLRVVAIDPRYGFLRLEEAK